MTRLLAAAAFLATVTASSFVLADAGPKCKCETPGHEESSPYRYGATAALVGVALTVAVRGRKTNRRNR